MSTTPTSYESTGGSLDVVGGNTPSIGPQLFPGSDVALGSSSRSTSPSGSPSEPSGCQPGPQPPFTSSPPNCNAMGWAAGACPHGAAHATINTSAAFVCPSSLPFAFHSASSTFTSVAPNLWVGAQGAMQPLQIPIPAPGFIASGAVVLGTAAAVNTQQLPVKADVLELPVKAAPLQLPVKGSGEWEPGMRGYLGIPIATPIGPPSADISTGMDPLRAPPLDDAGVFGVSAPLDVPQSDGMSALDVSNLLGPGAMQLDGEGAVDVLDLLGSLISQPPSPPQSPPAPATKVAMLEQPSDCSFAESRPLVLRCVFSLCCILAVASVTTNSGVAMPRASSLRDETAAKLKGQCPAGWTPVSSRGAAPRCFQVSEKFATHFDCTELCSSAGSMVGSNASLACIDSDEQNEHLRHSVLSGALRAAFNLRAESHLYAHLPHPLSSYTTSALS